MIRGLSENVIVPIAGIIITFVLCYELISMITEKNNLHDMDTWMFFKWFFKAAVAIYLVTNTFDIVMDKDTYLFTVTLRGDATSRFSKDNRWGAFPAVALGWKIINEPFIRASHNSRSISL